MPRSTSRSPNNSEAGRPHLLRASLKRNGASTAIAAIIASTALVGVPSQSANAAVVSACSGVSLPPSVVTGILSPVLNPLAPTLNLAGINLGNTVASINAGAPISLQVIDTAGNVVSNVAPCINQSDSFQLTTPAGISFGGNQITGLGNGTVASAANINAVAIGNGAVTTAPAVGAVALGNLASVTGAGGVALGSAANATATNAIAIGNAGGASGAGGVALGAAANATATNAVAIGNASGVTGVGGVALGATARAAGTNATAIGNAANANATGALALGAGAGTSIVNNVALGTNTVAGAANGGWAGTTIGATTIASNLLTANAVLGISGNGINRQIQGVADGAVNATSTDAINGSQLYLSIQALNNALTTTGGVPAAAPIAADNVNNLAAPTVSTGRNSVAVGYGATSTGINSVAIGNGSSDGGRANVVSVGTAGATRQVINVAAGTQGTDAVNVAQLQPLLSALGGGATVNTTTGAVTGPTYLIGGVSYGDVGSAISASSRLAVQYAPDAAGNPTNRIVLSGANNGQPVTISNVAAGITGTDAVNVNQLRAVSSRVDQIAANINGLQGNINQNQAEARRGVATTAAMANLPFGSTPGRWSPAVAFGGFKDQTAVAMGVQYNTIGVVSVKLRATASFVPGTNDVTFGGGAGMEF